MSKIKINVIIVNRLFKVMLCIIVIAKNSFVAVLVLLILKIILIVLNLNVRNVNINNQFILLIYIKSFNKKDVVNV